MDKYDPFLYNDQLQGSREKAFHWDDLPETITVDIFGQLGFMHKLIHRRVCRAWKSSLEESHSTLLIDSIDKIKRLPYSEDDELVKSVTSLRDTLRAALANTQAIIINFDQTKRIDRDDTDEQTPLRRFCSVIRMKEAIADSPKLRHVILANSRNFDYLFHCWLEDLGIETCQRPVTFSLVHCNVVSSKNNSELHEKNVSYGLFPAHYGEAKLPQLSLFSPMRERLLRHHIRLMDKELTLPYPNDQLIWLKNCRETLKNLGKLDFGCWNASEESFDKALNACIDGYYNKGSSEPPEDLESNEKYSFADGHDFERFAVSVSYIARMIAEGKLDLPPPPHPVPLCSTHITSAICTCLAAMSDVYEPFSTCENMKIHEKPREPLTAEEEELRRGWFQNELETIETIEELQVEQE